MKPNADGPDAGTGVGGHAERPFQRARAILSLTLVTFALSESAFWGQWPEAYGRGPVEIALTYLAYLVVVVAVLGVLERTRAGGVRGLVLGGALLGWLVEGVIVQTTYEALPFSISFTALAWHTLLTVLVGWWGIYTMLAGSTRRAAVVVAAGVVWGLWGAFISQDPERVQPADGIGSFAAYVLVTVLMLVVGLRGWQAARGPNLVGRWPFRVALGVLAVAAVVTTVVVPFAPLVLAPLFVVTVVAMRRSPGVPSMLTAPDIPTARLISTMGVLGLATIVAYLIGTTSGGRPTAEVWGYIVYMGTAIGGLAAWCVAVVRGLRARPPSRTAQDRHD